MRKHYQQSTRLENLFNMGGNVSVKEQSYSVQVKYVVNFRITKHAHTKRAYLFARAGFFSSPLPQTLGLLYRRRLAKTVDRISLLRDPTYKFCGINIYLVSLYITVLLKLK